MSRGERSPSVNLLWHVILTVSFTFSTLFNIAVSQKEGGPMGQPNRLKPYLVMGISGGMGLSVVSTSRGM